MPATRQLRFRSQLILVTALISFSLCAASLLIVRASVRREVAHQTQNAMGASVRAFHHFQQQQDSELLNASALLSELPPLKALMTANDPPTAQDASTEFWKLSGSDLLVLAGTQENVLAVHSPTDRMKTEAAQRLLAQSAEKGEQLGWWQSDSTTVEGDLYRIAIRPIALGEGIDRRVLGKLVLGKRIDRSVAERIQYFSGNDIALVSGNAVISSTLDASTGDRLAAILKANAQLSGPAEYSIGGHAYEVAEVAVQTDPTTPIRCFIFLPLDASNSFLQRLNWTIAILGIVIGLLGAAIMMFLSRRITGPLETLAGAVKAMARGDDSHSVPSKGTAEIRQLSSAFADMRSQIAESQRRQLEAERLAALGRAAGSISHDIRHILAALVANAEFLRDAEEIGCDRNEVYEEIQQASAQMTELIDSLIEIAREGNTLALIEASFEKIARRAANAVQNNPEFRSRSIRVSSPVETTGSFDPVKLERALFNLLLNACQATDPLAGVIGITFGGSANWIECSITDNGHGIPDEVKETLFQPFVSAGKTNGTGLGLAIALKIVNDHGGELHLQQTSLEGTTFVMRVPRAVTNSESEHLHEQEELPSAARRAP